MGTGCDVSRGLTSSMQLTPMNLEWQRQTAAVGTPPTPTAQLPCPEQELGHAANVWVEQSRPLKPAAHAHCPETQEPRPEQSLVQRRSVHPAPLQPSVHTHAVPMQEPCTPHPVKPHSGVSQAAPPHPWSQLQTASSHSPWPEHAMPTASVGQAVTAAMVAPSSAAVPLTLAFAACAKSTPAERVTTPGKRVSSGVAAAGDRLAGSSAPSALLRWCCNWRFPLAC
jgi:hypothetical protein